MPSDAGESLNVAEITMRPSSCTGDYDETVVVHAALAIAEIEIARLERDHGSAVAVLARHVHAHGLEHLARRAVVGAGIHEAGATHGGGDAPQWLHAGKTLVSGGERHVAQQRARLGRHAPMRCIHLNARKVVAQQYDDAADAAVAHQQI